MQNLLNDLKAVLEKDDRLIAEGLLLKNKIIELALAMDAGLIRLLLTHDGIKKHFFSSLDGIPVFDKAKFQQFVSNKAFLPDSYTAFKNKIGLTADGQYLTDSKEVVLAWPYKDCVLEGGQTKEDAKRDEIFWNETLAPDQIDRLLAPKALTNFKKYDKDGEHEVTGISQDDNLIIKGNNLLALHTLKAAYGGRVKLIYIDPPYNTEEDSFKYNDTFSRSTWLTFMKNRLEAAKPLLSDDGIIAVQINDKEQAYLKILLDEVFSENFRATICVKMSHLSGVKMSHKDKKIPKIKEHIHIYSKTDNQITIKPYYIPVTWDEAFDRYENFIAKDDDQPTDHSKWKSLSLNQALKRAGISKDNKPEAEKFMIDNAECIFQTALNRSKNYPKEPKGEFLLIDGTYVLNGREVYLASEKIQEVDGKKTPVSILGDIWSDIGINNVFQEGGDDISLRFGKKPESLLHRIIDLFTKNGDVVLDFFSGTATTAAVAHKMRRRWVALEQLDYIKTLSVPRLENVVKGDQTGISALEKWQGGGSFVYCELAQANQVYVDRIQSAETTKGLQTIWADMQDKAFLSYRVDPKKIDLNSADFNTMSLDDQKRFLIEVMDKNMLYVPVSEIDDKTYGISDDDKKLNRRFQGKA